MRKNRIFNALFSADVTKDAPIWTFCAEPVLILSNIYLINFIDTLDTCEGIKENCHMWKDFNFLIVKFCKSSGMNRKVSFAEDLDSQNSSFGD